MKLIGLDKTLWELVDQSKKKVIQWGIIAKEKADRLQQTTAGGGRKMKRKFAQASKRKNRGK